MNRHKTQRLTTRNWDTLVDRDEGGIASFEKVRPISRPSEAFMAGNRKVHSKQNFHRSRVG